MAEALRRTPDAPEPRAEPLLECRDLSVRAGERRILHQVGLAVRPGEILAVEGPSGVGKTTLLRCLNRLTDLVPELRVEGEVRFDGESVHAPGVDPDELRTSIGMLFQQPVIFPGSIRRNVLFGLRRVRRLSRGAREERLERALRQAALWGEVRDRLDEAAACLSVGQQQRLCLARALAVEPRALLLDEPTSALDEEAAGAVEELLAGLGRRLALVLVTHNRAQARRVAHRVLQLHSVEGCGEIREIREAAGADTSPVPGLHSLTPEGAS